MCSSAEIQVAFSQNLTLNLLPTKTFQHYEAVPKEIQAPYSGEQAGRQISEHQQSQDKLVENKVCLLA